jgi:hypothetical protein
MGYYQLLDYGGGENLLGKNIDPIKNNTDTLFDATK